MITMKSHIIFPRLTSVFLCLWLVSQIYLVSQVLPGDPRLWDRPFIFRVDSLTQNNVVLPISLPRATFLFDSTGKEKSSGVAPAFQNRIYMSVCYQIATDSLFTRDVAGTARFDSLRDRLYCFDIRDYYIATFRPYPPEITHIDSAFTANIRVRDLKPNTQYFARACVQCLRSNNDAPYTTFPSNIIKFTTLRETSVREEATGVGVFTLEQNAPNPFSDETSINFTLPEVSEVSLTIHDTFGRVVMEVAKGLMSAGQHQLRVLMGSLPSGVYSYRLGVNGRVLTRQMVHIR